MADAWQVAGRLAQAAIVGTCLIPVIAMALHLSLRRAPAGQRYRVWTAACVVMLSAILLAPLSRQRTMVPVPGAFARAAYDAGVPVTELVRLPTDHAGVTQYKRLIRSASPNVPFRAFLAVWLLGSVLIGVRTASSYRAAARLAAQAPPAPATFAARVTARVPESLRNANAAVCVAPARSPAFTWGILRPRIVLPLSLLQRPDDAALVLAHELHHVRSRDFAVQACADVLACIAWWNPFVWLVRRRISTEREYAADAAVLAAGADRAAYVEALLAAASAVTTPAPAAAAVSQLALRVLRILAWTQTARVAVHAAPAYALAIMLTVCVVVGMWGGVRSSIGARVTDDAAATLIRTAAPGPDHSSATANWIEAGARP